MLSMFKEGILKVSWTPDRKNVSISDNKKTINFTKDKCFKLVRPEKKNKVDIVKIDGSRFSGNKGNPSAIFFIPWRESTSNWSMSIPRREYTITNMFNNTISEVEQPD